jgi:hypothetical protein
MSFKLFILPAVVLSVVYGLAMASVASAEVTVTIYTWESECVLEDDMVECDISSGYGISNVHVFMNAGIGDVTVFDEDYDDCPTEVHVSLDPIVLEETSEMDVTVCGGPSAGDGETVIVCISGHCPGDPPDVGVGRIDPLPLRLRTDYVGPIAPTNSFARN